MSEVLVVGAGPAGLVAAITLARHGIGVHLVEKHGSTSTLPRATAVSTRTMEILRSWGLESEVRAGGVDVAFTAWASETLATADRGVELPLGFPTPAEAAAVSPTGPACVPQDHLEPVLLKHLTGYPTARVDFGTELVALTPDGAAVLRDRASGESRRVHHRYVVGADGIHSTVRSRVGLSLVGPDGLESVYTALFHAPLWAVVGRHRHGLYAIGHPDAAGVFVPSSRDDRWVYGREFPSGSALPAAMSEDDLVALIRTASGVPDLRPRIVRTGGFSFAAQIVDRYRVGNVFLVGDAAHRITPRGGTGMNTAIHDGYDLGWKLAWVLRGWAGAELLDSYEAERRPVGLHNTSRSADPEGSRRSLDETLHWDLNARIAHHWVRPGVSTVDLLGPGLTLFAGPATDLATVGAPTASPPLVVVRLDADAARALGLDLDGALLVGPGGRARVHEAGPSYRPAGRAA